MKRTWIIAAGMLVLSGAIYVSSHLMAQPGTTPAAHAAPQTRIALCNLSSVIKGYKKYQSFQAEIKVDIDRFQKKDTEIRENMKKYAELIAAPATAADKKAEYEKYMTQYKHLLEDNNAEAKNTLGKKSDDQMVILYKEVRDMAQRYATSQGIELVLHYNDADEKHEPAAFWSPANVARKMQAGASMPIVIAPGMDISEQLILMLNNAGAATAGAHN